MKIPEKIMISSIATLVSGMVALTPASAEVQKNIKTSDGLQITINITRSDHLSIIGRIQINVNEADWGDPANPLPLSISGINTGNYRRWEPFDIYNFDPWALTDPYYPFDRDGRMTAFGTFDTYGFGPQVYAGPGDAKILPPLEAPDSLRWPGAVALIDYPEKGLMAGLGFELPAGSVKKIGQHEYHVNFNNCQTEESGEGCISLDFTVKADGNQVSKFSGSRLDIFRTSQPDQEKSRKMTFTTEYVERSASVEGSVFGEKMYPHSYGVISNYTIVNDLRTFNP